MSVERGLTRLANTILIGGFLYALLHAAKAVIFYNTGTVIFETLGVNHIAQSIGSISISLVAWWVIRGFTR